MADVSAPHVRYILRERPVLRTFCADDSYEAEEFVADIRRAWARYDGEDAALRKINLLLASISKSVTRELQAYVDITKDDPEECLEFILKEFGEKRSTAELIFDILQLKQRPGEDIRRFSIRVNDAGLRLRSRQRALKEAEVCPTLVRDQLIDGVEDDLLRKFLKEQVRKEPASTFLQVRETALVWEKADRSSRPQVPVRTSFQSMVQLVEASYPKVTPQMQ